MLVAMRGKLMQALPHGSMLSVALPAEEIEPLLSTAVNLAAINGPRLCVVAGPSEAIESLEQQLIARGVECRRLHTSHAFHSAMLDPIVAPFTQHVARVKLQPPAIPFISNVTGTWISNAEATDPAYWGRQLRATVNFAAGLTELIGPADAPQTHVLLEVGPGQTLSTLARQHPASTHQAVLRSLRHTQERIGDSAFLALTIGRLWLAGVALDWTALADDQRRLRVPLPTYPFERQRYWIDPRESESAPEQRQARRATAAESKKPVFALHQRPAGVPAYVEPGSEIERRIATIWQELLGVEQIGVHDNFFEMGGHSLMATQLVARLQDVFPVDLSIRALFELATLAELAEQIETLLIAKIEALPEDEAEQLVADLLN